MTENLTPEQQERLELAEKLFRVAGRSKGEADQYVAKAMAILEELNLDMSVLEEGGSDKVKRSDNKFGGGRYVFQREIWSAVAELHFCRYWTQYNWDPDKVAPYTLKKYGAEFAKRHRGGYRHEHRLVGRTVNVVATRNMAQYIEHTIARLLRDHLEEEVRKDHPQSPYCISFCRGVADSMVAKIYERRQHLLDEEARRSREAAERAAASGVAGETGRALTLGSLRDQEEVANYDFVHGEGAWARVEAARVERARKRREAQDLYTAWAAANPEEARKQEQERLEEERRAESRRRRGGVGSRGGRGPEDKVDWRAFSAGERAGRGASIDPQAEGRRAPAGLL